MCKILFWASGAKTCERFKQRPIELNALYFKLNFSANCILAIQIINFEIILSNLYMKKEQYHRIKNVGLSKFKNDIYDISEKKDIIVKIIIK